MFFRAGCLSDVQECVKPQTIVPKNPILQNTLESVSTLNNSDKNETRMEVRVEKGSEIATETPSKVLQNSYTALENVTEPEKDNNNTTYITKPKFPPPIVLHT